MTLEKPKIEETYVWRVLANRLKELGMSGKRDTKEFRDCIRTLVYLKDSWE